MLGALGTGREQPIGTSRNLFVFDDGQTTVTVVNGSRSCAGSGYYGCGGKKRAATGVHLGFCRFACGAVGEAQTDSLLVAVADAVEAIYATAHVDSVRLRIDAFRLAVACAFLAAVAFLLIDCQCENRVAAEDAQHGAYRAKRVAPEAAAEQRHGEDDQHQYGNQRVCAPAVVRTRYGGYGFAEEAVRLEEMRPYCRDREERQRDEAQQYAEAEELHLFGGTEAVRSEMFAQLLHPFAVSEPDEEILQNAHRANDGAIDATDAEGDDQQQGQREERQTDDRRPELQFGHPSDVWSHDRSVHQQQGDTYYKYARERDAQCAEGVCFLIHSVFILNATAGWAGCGKRFRMKGLRQQLTYSLSDSAHSRQYAQNSSSVVQGGVFSFCETTIR